MIQKPFESASKTLSKDYKRIGEDDKGPNTGGMGAYSPSRLINSNLDKKIINKIIYLVEALCWPLAIFSFTQKL